MEQIESFISEDVLLLQKIKEGSKHAFNILFEKYWGKAYSDAFKRLKNHDDAKDIVQEIFTTIWLKRETQKIENFPAYLYVAIRNNVIKLLAKQKPIHPYFVILDNIAQKDCEADGNLLWKEFYKTYETLVETLPPKRQEIFRLHYQQDLSTKDISIQLGITRKTVQNQLGKAIESLKIVLHLISITWLILIILIG